MENQMENYFLQDLNALRMTVHDSFSKELSSAFHKTAQLMIDALKNGKKILVCGNGGSAADAEHMVGELVGRFGYDRPSLPGISLCTPSATFTAISNDYGYDLVFKRQVQGLGQAGDVLLGISTSGNSKNVVAAFEEARKMNIATVALTGYKSSKLEELADICMKSLSRKTPRVQEIHGLLIHSLCRAIEEQIFPEKAPVSLPVEKIVSKSQIENFAKAITGYHSVFTNGCFDVLHPGHIKVLKESRNFGELLIVGLNSDDSIKRLKGESRPYHNFEDRALMLASLEFVDYVIEFTEDTPAQLIQAITPKVLVKGGDYDRSTIVGADWVEKHGGEVKVVSLLDGHSTTGILKNGI
jgi:phosphoheptose isomerase